MAVPKANQRAVNKYVKNNYDRINVTMPKGKKDTIQAHAEASSQSVNAYINAAIDSRMGQEGTGEARGISLSPDTLKAAQRAAEAAGEAVPVFIDRAITTQARRDELGRGMGGGEHK